MEKEIKIIAEDHICPVCYTVFLRPIYLRKCLHKLCENCVNDIMILMGTNICPLCRQDFRINDIIQDDKLWQIIQAEYPDEVREKQEMIKERIIFKILIGNTTRQIQTQQDNKYEWCLFIKPAEGQTPLNHYIDKITIKLHPTFFPAQITYNIVNQNRLQVKRTGWGTFNIGVIITWKNNLFEERTSEFQHQLQFMPFNEKVQTTYLHLNKQQKKV